MNNKSSLSLVLSLFTSGGTLICCALPALFVALGAGAVLSSIIAVAPQLVWFSLHKVEIFTFATIMLLISGILQFKARNLPCPVDKQLAKTCAKTRKTSFKMYIFSLIIYAIGGFFAFVAPWINT